MISSGMQKLLVVLAVLAVLGFVGYQIFLTEVEISADPTLEPVTYAGKDILDLVAELDALIVDQSFFTSSAFLSLVDYKIPVQPEVQGRENPFASFAGGSTVRSGTQGLPR